MPASPVWIVTSVWPSISPAKSFTSSIDLVTRTPPLAPAGAPLKVPLPRPPAWIWLFTTQTGPPSSLAAASASSGLKIATPLETGSPNSFSTALAWYSWMFIGFPGKSE